MPNFFKGCFLCYNIITNKANKNNRNEKGERAMGNIINCCLDVLSKAVGDICLFLTDVAAGTISMFGVYEPEMPAALRAKCDDESE